MNKPDVVVRRTFKNETGDWKKMDPLVKEILTYGKVIDDLARDLVTADRKLRELMQQAYKTAPRVDSLFIDSPAGPQRQTYALKAYLKKLGWDGVRDVITPTIAIDEFQKAVKDGVTWLLKFRNEKE